MTPGPLEKLIRGNRGRDNLPPVIDERALSRLDYTNAQFDIPTPKRVEDLPVKTASQEQQDTSQDVEVEQKSGVATSDAEAGWYEVTFDEPFVEGTRPSVVAVCEERKGEFEEGDFRSPEHGSPQEGSPGVADISLGDVSIAGVDLGTYSIGDFSVSSSSVSARSISDRGIEERGVSERSIDSEGVATFDNVFKNFSLEEFSAGDVELEFGEIDVDIPEAQGFEEQFKQNIRDVGRTLSQLQEDVVRATIPDIPYSNRLENFFIEVNNDYLRFGFGASDVENDGEGTLESTFGLIGAILDETVRQWIVSKANEEIKLANKANKAIKDQKGVIESEIKSVEKDIANQINNKLVDQMNDRLEKLRSNSDDAVGYLGRNADTELKNLIQEINEVRSEFASDVDTQFTGLSSDINSRIEEMAGDINGSFETNAEEINSAFSGLTGEINDAMAGQNEDINANLIALRDSVEENILQVRDDTEVNIIELRDSIEEAFEQVVETSINQGLSDYNSNVQQSYRDLGGMSQEALNQSPKLLYDSIGAPEGELITPVQVRNVDHQSFEFLGYEGGMTIDWMAMGVTQATDDTEQTDPSPPPEDSDPPEDGDGEDESDSDDESDGSDGGDNQDGEEDPTPRPPVDTPILDKIVERREGN